MLKTVTEDRIARLLGYDHAVPLAERHLAEAGLLLEGHFHLRGNQHSRQYVHIPSEFYDSEIGQRVLDLFYDQLNQSQKFDLSTVDVVIGPDRGGAIFVQHLAKRMNIFRARSRTPVEYVSVSKSPGSEYGYKLTDEAILKIKGKRVAAGDDVWNTGITLAGYILPMLRSAGARVVAVAVLANRGNASLPPLCAFEDFWQISHTECFPREFCPMCLSDDPKVREITRF
jgi:adenine/guanine phosphoribosyltransferase-like PRPP-binding protein